MTINPHRITVALNHAGLYGKTADAKVHAVEPELDDWEAGRAVPNPKQLRALCSLAGIDEAFLHLPDDAYPRIAVAFLCRGPASGATLYLADPWPEPAQQALL
jgi:hypothetical protein